MTFDLYPDQQLWVLFYRRKTDDDEKYINLFFDSELDAYQFGLRNLNGAKLLAVPSQDFFEYIDSRYLYIEQELHAQRTGNPRSRDDFETWRINKLYKNGDIPEDYDLPPEEPEFREIAPRVRYVRLVGNEKQSLFRPHFAGQRKKPIEDEADGDVTIYNSSQLTR